MRDRIILAGVVFALAGLLYWQVQHNGELAAVNDQYLTTIDAQTDALNDLAARTLKTNALLADTRRQFRTTQHRAQELSDALKNVSDECVNSVVSAAVVERVQQFQAGDN